MATLTEQQFGVRTMAIWQEEIREKYGYELASSLGLSKCRYRSFLYIGDHPYINIHEVSMGTGFSYANTYGAILGDGKKYSKKHSLANMKLVQCTNAGGVHVCELTKLGKEIAAILKKRDK